MNKTKEKFKKILGIKRQILELILASFVLISIYKHFDFIDITDFKIPIINLKLGEDVSLIFVKWMILIISFIALYIFFKQINQGAEFVSGEVYAAYPYFFYKISSSLLNISTCSLVGVPIYMQYKLVIRKTFSEYKVGGEQKCDTISIIPPNIHNKKDAEKSINLVISDTFEIEQNQLPQEVLEEYTIFVKRNRENGVVRVYDQDFLNQIHLLISSLPPSVDTVNLFCTTNTSHNKWLAENVFFNANRANIRHLNVYQQEGEEPRNFSKIVKIK